MSILIVLLLDGLLRVHAQNTCMQIEKIVTLMKHISTSKHPIAIIFGRLAEPNRSIQILRYLWDYSILRVTMLV